MFRVYNYGYRFVAGVPTRNRVPFCTHKGWKTERGALNYIARNWWYLGPSDFIKKFHADHGIPDMPYFVAHDSDKIENCGCVYRG